MNGERFGQCMKIYDFVAVVLYFSGLISILPLCIHNLLLLWLSALRVRVRVRVRVRLGSGLGLGLG